MTLTDEQIAIRRTRVTASSLPAFLGYSGYISPSDAWRRHLEHPSLGKRSENQFTGFGHIMEPSIAKGTMEVLKLEEHQLIPGETLVHPDHPWLAATPDYLVGDMPLTGIECKNHQPHMKRISYKGPPGSRGEWDNGLVPLEYELQCQIQMIVVSGHYGHSPLYWYLAAYFGGADLRCYKIRRDEKLQEALLKAGHRFWMECIDPAGPMGEPNPILWPWKVGIDRGQEYAKKAMKVTGDALLSSPLPDLPMDDLDLPEPL